MLGSGHWAVTLVEQNSSRKEVLMAFDGGWGWKDRKYVLSGNNGSGTLELQVRVKIRRTTFSPLNWIRQ